MNDDWLALGCAILAIMLALVGILLPESGSFPPNYPYNNLTGIPQTFPYGNLTGIPNTFPYSNVTEIPNTYPYGNLTGIPQTFPYGNLTDIPQTFPYGNLTGVPNVDLMHSLVLWLPFDGVALDKSGYNNDGTVYGASYVTGKFASALSCDGYNDYVVVAENPLVDIVGKGLSVAVWVKPVVSQTTFVGMAGKFYQYQFAIDGLRVRCYLYGSGAPDWVYASADLTLNVFSFVVFTYDGVNIKIYINSVLSNSVAWSGDIIHVGSNFRVGMYEGNNYFNGTLDDVRVYNRGLNQAEITALYNLP